MTRSLVRRRCPTHRGSVQGGTVAAAVNRQGPCVRCEGSLSPASATIVHDERCRRTVEVGLLETKFFMGFLNLKILKSPSFSVL